MAGVGWMRLLCVLTLGACLTAPAQETEATTPFKLIRYEESWSRNGNAGLAGDLFAPLKAIPLGSSDGWQLTIGGEVRQRYENFRNPTWALDPADDSGYLLQRYMLHTDLHLGRRARFFGQLKSNFETGRTGGPRPPDEDRLDVHQAFFESALWSAGEGTMRVRAGRQEVSLGSARLLGIREGPNVRQSFDGGRIALDTRRWKVELLALRPVETNRGVFDDSPSHQRSLWGVYSTVGGRIDFYYLGLDRRAHQFDQGIAREQRHSAGLRAFGRAAGWDYDYEALWQFGTFGQADIRAWTVATHTGYSWPHLPLQPRLSFKADIASGDRDPLDRKLGTFNALYPKGAYFSEADLLGPYNIMDLHPALALRISRAVRFTVDADCFWRHSTEDGVYDMPGNLLVSGRGIAGRYIGSHANSAIEWEVSHNFTLAAHYLRFFPGEFLKQAGLNRPVNFVGVWGIFRF